MLQEQRSLRRRRTNACGVGDESGDGGYGLD
jgi:hypothetical protein